MVGGDVPDRRPAQLDLVGRHQLARRVRHLVCAAAEASARRRPAGQAAQLGVLRDLVSGVAARGVGRDARRWPRVACARAPPVGLALAGTRRSEERRVGIQRWIAAQAQGAARMYSCHHGPRGGRGRRVDAHRAASWPRIRAMRGSRLPMHCAHERNPDGDGVPCVQTRSLWGPFVPEGAVAPSYGPWCGGRSCGGPVCAPVVSCCVNKARGPPALSRSAVCRCRACPRVCGAWSSPR
eukprot:2889426-Prymnesium_polylepis.1